MIRRKGKLHRDLCEKHEYWEMHVMRVYEEDSSHWPIILETYILAQFLMFLCKFRSPLYFSTLYPPKKNTVLTMCK
jgi:hypothetical protein